MSAAADRPTVEAERGLLVSLRRLAATGVEIAYTRLEILTSDLEEERARLGSMIITGVLGLFCTFMASILFTILIVVLLWETHRVPVLALLGGIFLLGAVLCWRSFQQQRQDRPAFLATTLGELAKDRRELTSR
ncbi:MAG TPA: phage holin family protein [Burkholderiales bacterium]|nr:phage holin family protein [Burkholderiales bacterium]